MNSKAVEMVMAIIVRANKGKDFLKVGDVVNLIPELNNVSYRGKFKAVVVRKNYDDKDIDGIPIVRVQRLDTKAKGRENWSQGWLELAKGG